MNIVVCLKQIIDYEIPPRAFRIDRQKKKPAMPDASLVIGPFDENALEVALQLREKAGGGRITAVSMGPESAIEALRKALAVTADEAVLLSDPAFSDLDPFGTARVLGAAIKKLGGADLVLTGRQSGDWDAGQVGQLLAEELGAPCVNFAFRAEPGGDGRVRLYKETPGGAEILEAGTPVVATVTNAETNQLRLAKVRDLMAANRKPVPTWSAADLGLDPAALAAGRIEVLDLYVPTYDARCEFVTGETPEDKASALARRLVELKLV